MNEGDLERIKGPAASASALVHGLQIGLEDASVSRAADGSWRVSGRTHDARIIPLLPLVMLGPSRDPEDIIVTVSGPGQKEARLCARAISSAETGGAIMLTMLVL